MVARASEHLLYSTLPPSFVILGGASTNPARVFFEPLLSNCKLKMNVKSTTDSYTITITVPFFDVTDFKGVSRVSRVSRGCLSV